MTSTTIAPVRHLILTLLTLLAVAAPDAAAQDIVINAPTAEEIEQIEARGGRKRPIEGYYYFTPEGSEDGEEALMLVMTEVTVYPPLKFKNKKEEEFYWKTVRDVRKTLPYAKLICETLIETYEYIETFPTQKEREEHLKKMEGAVFEQYKPVLKKFTKSQAQMLIKLIGICQAIPFEILVESLQHEFAIRSLHYCHNTFRKREISVVRDRAILHIVGCFQTVCHNQKIFRFRIMAQSYIHSTPQKVR